MTERIPLQNDSAFVLVDDADFERAMDRLGASYNLGLEGATE